MLLSETVIDNWAEALKKIAIDADQVDEFIAQANLVVDVLKDQSQFVQILNSKNKNVDQAKIIDEVFADNGINSYITNALKILAETNRFAYAREIMKHLRKKLVSSQNIIYGVAWSTEPLAAAQMTAMEQKMSTHFHKEVRLLNKLDPSLIGGVQLVIENHVFDGSIKGKIHQMKRQALKNHHKE